VSPSGQVPSGQSAKTQTNPIKKKTRTLFICDSDVVEVKKNK
jgi:hypothetical protein